MLAKVESATVVGVMAIPVTVEVDVADGLPGVTIVGLPDPTVKESKERIRAAIRNTHCAWPQTRVTVNLAPADVRKQGSAFDLPIALGLLAASNQLEPQVFADTVVLGELALDGALRPIPGALPIALSLKGKARRLLLPAENAPEAGLVRGTRVYPMKNLAQAIAFLRGTEEVAPLAVDPEQLLRVVLPDGLDFAEIRGQAAAKRAVEVAVAGGHNLLLIGPPGAGKTMLAQRIPTIMSEPSPEEALETTQIYSIMGLTSSDQPLIVQRPLRSPHHTISEAGLVGGGTEPKPGEISLAHHGILFLDELPEFSRGTLESLRQPLETGIVTVSRVQGRVTFPARFMLVASMNPCPCGCLGDSARACLCTPSQVQRYRARVSGPLLDRIDLHLEVSAVPLADLTGETDGEPSAAIRARILQARARQQRRFQGEPGVFCNAQMRYRHLKRWCRIDAEGKDLLRRALQLLGLSARGYHKVLKVSRTIADLAGSPEIRPEHLAEAIQYRTLDRRTQP